MPQFGSRYDDGDWTPPGRGPQVPPVIAPPPAPVADPNFGNYEIPQYGGPSSPTFNFQQAPSFHALQFKTPTFAEAQQDPGYQFRLDAGRQALERSAAARGLLRTGGTLKDIAEYGQKYGAQEYADVFNRALQAQQANEHGREAEFAPQFAQYNNQFGAEQARGLAGFQRAFDVYQSGLNANQNREGMIFNALNVPAPSFPQQYPG